MGVTILSALIKLSVISNGLEMLVVGFFLNFPPYYFKVKRPSKQYILFLPAPLILYAIITYISNYFNVIYAVFVHVLAPTSHPGFKEVIFNVLLFLSFWEDMVWLN